MLAGGLVSGTEGNVSARYGELVAVSPTSLAYETLRPEDVSLRERREDLNYPALGEG